MSLILRLLLIGLKESWIFIDADVSCCSAGGIPLRSEHCRTLKLSKHKSNDTAIVRPMNGFANYRRLTASSQRRVAWLVLFALLFIQVRVAVGGCLVSGYPPPPQQAEPVMQMKSAGDPCTGPNSADKLPCMKHCEQSSDTPKFAFDLPFVVPVALPTSEPLFTVADVSSFETPTQSPATTGPPPYLRFLRLLN